MVRSVWSGLAAVSLTGALLVFASLGAGAQSSPAAPASNAAVVKTAEQAYKNIVVLKGTPADQLIPAMQFISASLGVQCSYCHNTKAFAEDKLKPKETARNMIRMELAINKENFKGAKNVTCYSCHRGSTAPVAIPEIGTEHKPQTAQEEKPEAGDATVSAETIVNHFIQVVGGVQALQKIATRGESGTISFNKITLPIDVLSKAPNKRISLLHQAAGDYITAFNGKIGWLDNPGEPSRMMTTAETYAAQLDAEIAFPYNLPHMFSQMHVSKSEKVNGRDCYVVLGSNTGQPDVKLYFDKESGLLVRMVRYADSPLGKVPTQVDFADYRNEKEVKMPYSWTLARPGGGFTIQVIRADQNIPLKDAKFMPKGAPAGGD
ncbi:MAG TPA: c-type cytochrome [Candidatus Limnocylindrales bacterium]|nr:c-type cytochrome [Candidatus Limnocylindrales bacterium]